MRCKPASTYMFSGLTAGAYFFYPHCQLLKCLLLFSYQCQWWRRFLDGIVWPQEDEKQVKLMMAMIHHCTGMPLTILRQDLWPRTEVRRPRPAAPWRVTSNSTLFIHQHTSTHSVRRKRLYKAFCCCRCAPEGLVSPQG